MVKKEKCYVGGKFLPTKHYFNVFNPYTRDVIAKCPIADDDLLETAMESAVAAFEPFASLKRFERSEMLRRIEEGIAKNHEKFSRLIMMEGGKPIKFARNEVDRARFTCRWAAEEALRFGGEWPALDIHSGAKDYTGLLGRIPLGPTLAVSPFNFPLNLVMHKLAPAIAVGCPTILKPSSDTPLTSLLLAKVCDDAGLPAGTVQVTPCRGASFEKLVTDDRAKMLSFTGSDVVGWRLKEISKRKRVALELGGNAAVVVHDDPYDLQWAAERIAFGGYSHAGQICISVQRVLVHEAVYDEFVKLLVIETRKIKSGDPSDESTVCGPMIRPEEIDRIQELTREAVSMGSDVLVKARKLDGNVLTPALLANVPAGAKVWSDELFGPVIAVNKYGTWDEAMAIVNESRYGLQASVFTRDINKILDAYKRLEVGCVVANDIPTIRVDNYPYGGTKDSGQGREGVRCTMEEMTEDRMLVIRT